MEDPEKNSGIRRIWLIEAIDGSIVEPEWYESEGDAREAAPDVTGHGDEWEACWRVASMVRETFGAPATEYQSKDREALVQVEKSLSEWCSKREGAFIHGVLDVVREALGTPATEHQSKDPNPSYGPDRVWVRVGEDSTGRACVANWMPSHAGTAHGPPPSEGTWQQYVRADAQPTECKSYAGVPEGAHPGPDAVVLHVDLKSGHLGATEIYERTYPARFVRAPVRPHIRETECRSNDEARRLVAQALARCGADEVGALLQEAIRAMDCGSVSEGGEG